MPRFVGMIANQRSGTHLLRGCFNSHPDVLCPPEPMYRSAPVREAGLQRFLAQYDGETRVVVLDIKYDQITPVVEKFLRTLPVLHLVRRDMKRMFLSAQLWRFYNNLCTPEEHERADKHQDFVKLQIGIERYNAYKKYVLEQRERFAYLADLIVFYEELTAGDREVKVLAEHYSVLLCAFLGVTTRPLVANTGKETPHSTLDTHFRFVPGNRPLERQPEQ